MTKKRLLLATIGIVALLSVAVTGIIYAGPLGQTEDNAPIPRHAESIGEIIQKQEGDDTVLATVNGHDFTTHRLRIAYESYMLEKPSLTRNEAIKATILATLDTVLLASEAESRGLTTTRDEAQALVQTTKSTCEENAEIEAECRGNLRKMGLDYDQYWGEIVSSYQDDYTALKAMTSLREDYLDSENTDAEGQKLDWLAIHEVREDATIVWNDNDIKTLFDQAHTERGESLERSD